MPIGTARVPSQTQKSVFSPDGISLFIQSEAPLRLEALDARTGASVFAVDLPGHLQALTMTADGRLAGLIGPPDDQPCGPEPGACPPSTAFWSSADGTLLDERPGIPGTEPHGTNPNGDASFWCSSWSDLCATEIIDFSEPTQSALSLTIWRTDGTPVQTLNLSAASKIVAFSPDGQYIANSGFVGASDGVRVFRISDGKLVGRLNFDWSLL